MSDQQTNAINALASDNLGALNPAVPWLLAEGIMTPEDYKLASDIIHTNAFKQITYGLLNNSFLKDPHKKTAWDNVSKSIHSYFIEQGLDQTDIPKDDLLRRYLLGYCQALILQRFIPDSPESLKISNISSAQQTVAIIDQLRAFKQKCSNTFDDSDILSIIGTMAHVAVTMSITLPKDGNTPATLSTLDKVGSRINPKYTTVRQDHKYYVSKPGEAGIDPINATPTQHLDALIKAAQETMRICDIKKAYPNSR